MNSEKKILIIDPDDVDRNVMATFLKQHNFSVQTGKGFLDALKVASEGGLDCLIMDLDLPEMKDFDAVSIFRNLDPNIKIVITAKKNSMEMESKIREQDIYYYFIKSFSKDELKLVINNALNQ